MNNQEKESNMNSISSIAAKTLGDSTSYAVYTDTIDNSLLNPMPREAGLSEMGLTGIKHVGGDAWHGHEMTFLLDNGAPLAGTLKVVYDANSPNMVESKSFKIYLNTFDMCKMGNTKELAVANMVARVKKDLSEVVGSDVQVAFFENGAMTAPFDPSIQYQNIENFFDITQINVDDYNGKYSHIESKAKPGKHLEAFTTNALRSRCKVTRQRDIGSAFIKIETQDTIVDPISLFKQIVSLREQDEFHEFCSSKLYSEIMKAPGVTGCCVTLLYARRGSLDICPTRASRVDLLPSVLTDANTLTRKTQGQ